MEGKNVAIDARLGIIGGNGWLGNAIAKSGVVSGALDPSHLTLSSRSGRRGQHEIEGAYWTTDNNDLVARSDVIVLSVRPQQFSDVAIDARGKLVISVMAGVTAAAIADQTGAVEIVRSIPNAAAAIQRSFTPWFAMPAVRPESKAIVQSLFEACGDAAEVPMESHIDYCVGMTGSGAAFPALLAQAMISHAVTQGLSPVFAKRAAESVVSGASQLFAGIGSDTKQIVQEMIDYGGTTAAALEAMTRDGFLEAVAAGLIAASAKTAVMAAVRAS